ncbi:MAG: hypothetical protein P9L94_08900 [Candidatus Hinthialibacter antarcticus]|nr:hypothetical protein [Candidatus Hinthialibacter antarcticus]
MICRFSAIVFFIIAQPVFAQWAHQYADIQSTNFITLPETASRAINIPLIDSFETQHFYSSLLSGDVDGDHVNELVALSNDQKNLAIVDFFERKKIVVPFQDDITEINLLFLTDFDEDGAQDIVFQSSKEPDIHFIIYSPKQETTLFEYNYRAPQIGAVSSTSRLTTCTPIAFIDANFDRQKEIITLKSFTDDRTILTMISSRTTEEQILLETNRIDDSSLVMTSVGGFEETYIIFSTLINGVTNLNAYIIEKNSQEALLLWSKPLRPNDSVSRIAASNGDLEEPVVYVGINSDDPDQERFFSKINLLTGEEEQTFSIDRWDCIDLAAGDFDGNGLAEATLLTTDSNLRRLDFEMNSSRIFTINDTHHYIGGIELLNSNRGIEHCIVQNNLNGFELVMLNYDFSPIFLNSSVLIRGNKISRGILGDFDGNHLGEIVISSQSENGSRINRVYFADPLLPPFPLGPITTIEGWEIY